MPILVFVFTICLFVILTSTFFSCIADLFGDSDLLSGADFSKFTKVEEFFMVVAVAPLLETLLFQYIPIKVVRLFVKDTHYAIVGSAISFALSHYHNWFYILNTFLIGLIFGYAFIASEKRLYSPFLIVFFIHSLYNLYAFIVKNYL